LPDAAGEAARRVEVTLAHLRAAARYRPRPCELPARLLLASETQADGHDEAERRWRAALSYLAVRVVPGDHFSMLREEHAATLARALLADRNDKVGRTWSGTTTTSS
jgi:thioesterase domain-containing protein